MTEFERKELELDAIDARNETTDTDYEQMDANAKKWHDQFVLEKQMRKDSDDHCAELEEEIARLNTVIATLTEQWQKDIAAKNALQVTTTLLMAELTDDAK